MAKAKSKSKPKKSVLMPTPREELARLLGTSVSGTARIPAVGVTYELTWEMRDHKCYASLRVVSVNRKPSNASLVMRNF